MVRLWGGSDARGRVPLPAVGTRLPLVPERRLCRGGLYPDGDCAAPENPDFRAGNGDEARRGVHFRVRAVLSRLSGAWGRLGTVPHVRRQIRQSVLVFTEQRFRLHDRNLLLHDFGPDRPGRGAAFQRVGGRLHRSAHHGHLPDPQEHCVPVDSSVGQKFYPRYGIFHGLFSELRRSPGKPLALPADRALCPAAPWAIPQV